MNGRFLRMSGDTLFGGSSTSCRSRVRLHGSTVAIATGIGTAFGALAGLISPEWKRRVP